MLPPRTEKPYCIYRLAVSCRDILDANYIWKNVRRTHAHTSCRSMGRALSQIQSILPPSFLCDSRTSDKPQVINMAARAFLSLCFYCKCVFKCCGGNPSSIRIQSHTKIHGTLLKRVKCCDFYLSPGPSKRPFTHPDRYVRNMKYVFYSRAMESLEERGENCWVSLFNMGNI